VPKLDLFKGWVKASLLEFRYESRFLKFRLDFQIIQKDW